MFKQDEQTSPDHRAKEPTDPAQNDENNELISTEDSVDVDQPGTYELLVRNAENGCVDSTEVEVTEDVEDPEVLD